MSGSPESEAMERALALAARGWGRVSPNPLVGAVVVKDGCIVGEGFHAELGAAHAEVAALAEAGKQAIDGSLFVTLEPCRHHGRTPPCTDAIIAAGIRQVSYAVSDPTQPAGGGAAELRTAGIAVDRGLLAADVVGLIAPFLWKARTGRPFVDLKLALSADGAIAARPGQRTTISGPESWGEVHRLRAGADAIVVGRRTVEADDPLLTPRGTPLPRVAPLRVVLDAGARLDPTCTLVRTAGETAVLVLAARDAPSDRVQGLESAGVEVLEVPRTAGGYLDPAAVLQRLGDRGAQCVLIEGGARVAQSFLAAGLVERYHEFRGPDRFGPDSVPGPKDAPRGEQGGWRLASTTETGTDMYKIWERVAAFDAMLEAA